MFYSNWSLIIAAIVFSIVSALTSSCGADNSGSGEPKSTDSLNEDGSRGGVQASQDEPKPLVVEYRKDGDQLALAVADTKDLPECVPANDRQLAWVKGTEQFFTCSDSHWVEIPVQNGKNGADGKDGLAGAAGADGKDGETGPKGDPGLPPSPNEWVDPVTHQRWFFGVAHVNIDAKEDICSGDWTLPDSVSAAAAALHGLTVVSAAMQGPTALWTSTIDYSSEDGSARGTIFVRSNGVAYTSGVSLYPNDGFPGVACLHTDPAP